MHLLFSVMQSQCCCSYHATLYLKSCSYRSDFPDSISQCLLGYNSAILFLLAAHTVSQNSSPKFLHPAAVLKSVRASSRFSGNFYIHSSFWSDSEKERSDALVGYRSSLNSIQAAARHTAKTRYGLDAASGLSARFLVSDLKSGNADQ